jgi:beta-glucosidase
MFDKTEFDNIPFTVVECDEHQKVAHKAAAEGIVLLKNDGILPLDKTKLKTIGVVGPNADSRIALMGNYHGTSSRFVTVLEGIEDKVEGDVRVLYSEGCDLWKPNLSNLSDQDYPDRLSEVQTIADYSDIMVVVVGLDENLEGEEGDAGNQFASGDKVNLELPIPQRQLLNSVLDCNKPTIVINMSGSAINLSVAQEKAAAVIQAWYPGAKGGQDVADILFGDVSPSGKLPVTFYRSTDDLPDFRDYSMKNRTYRYFTGTPLYPFGYGLTYGKCRAKEMEVTVSADGATVKVKVVNEGSVKTSDVLQIYVKDTGYELAVPNPQLAGFERFELGAGEEKEITVELPRRAFTSVDEEGNRDVFSHSFKVYAGTNQPDERSKELTGVSCIEKDVTI